MSFPREDAASGPPEDVMGQESQEEPLIYSENGSGLYARAARESGGLYMREGGGGSSSGLYREDMGYERDLGSSLYSRQEYRAETKLPFFRLLQFTLKFSSFAKVTFICWCQD